MTTETIVPADVYNSLITSLRSPRRNSYNSFRILESLHSHEGLEEDPEYPTPTSGQELLKLFDASPKWLKIYFLIVMIKMSMGAWQDSVDQRSIFLSPRQRIWAFKFPIDLIDMLLDYIELNHFNNKKLELMRDRVFSLQYLIGHGSSFYLFNNGPYQYWRLCPTICEIGFRMMMNGPFLMMSELSIRTQAVFTNLFNIENYENFVRDWWRQVRSRLAFADAMNFEMEVTEARKMKVKTKRGL